MDTQAWLLTLLENGAVRSQSLAALYRTIQEWAATMGPPTPSAAQPGPAPGALKSEVDSKEFPTGGERGEDASEASGGTRQERDARVPTGEPWEGGGAAAKVVAQANGSSPVLRRRPEAASGAEAQSFGTPLGPGNKQSGSFSETDGGKGNGSRRGTAAGQNAERGVDTNGRRFGEKKELEFVARQFGFDLELVERVVAAQGTEERDYDTWKVLVPLATPAGDLNRNQILLLTWIHHLKGRTWHWEFLFPACLIT